jgi:autonomous glycyl radical cofactor GrcA
MRNHELNHGPGKGDKSRVNDDVAYADNLAQVEFSGVPVADDPTFRHNGAKHTKVYGPREPEKDKTYRKPIIH